MTAYERVRFLRKNILKLNQIDFAAKINVSRSNLGNIEIGRINLTERVINDICREFSINKEWLLNGKEPVHVDLENVKINEIAEIYKSLNEDSRKYLRGYIDRLLEEQNTERS